MPSLYCCGPHKSVSKHTCKYLLHTLHIHTGGIRTHSSTGEWAVSYHGTKSDCVDSIAQAGYDLSKCETCYYGMGIYSAPKIEVAEGYAPKFSDGNSEYKVVLQNRVCSTNLKIVNKGEYWVQPDDTLIRPYGFCIKEC